eukprot:638759-Amphidinium_carterae.1
MFYSAEMHGVESTEIIGDGFFLSLPMGRRMAQCGTDSCWSRQWDEVNQSADALKENRRRGTLGG